MNWTEIAQFNLDDQWQLSPPVGGELFRIRHLAESDARGLIAQCFLENQNLQLLNITRFKAQTEAQIFQFPSPAALGDRHMAVRLTTASQAGWPIAIDVLEGASQATAYTVEFEQSHLSVLSILPVIHNLEANISSIVVFDNFNQVIWPDWIQVIDPNTIAINLESYTPIQGVWQVSVAI